MVIMQIWTGNPKDVVESEDPSPQLIESTIDALNNKDRTGLHLRFASDSRKMLKIFGGNKGRVVVIYYDSTKDVYSVQSALTDPQYSPEDGEIDINVTGSVNPMLLCRTVTKDVAKQVALYYAQHGSFPEDLVWEGGLAKGDKDQSIKG